MSEKQLVVYIGNPTEAPHIEVEDVGSEFYIRATVSAERAEYIKSQVEALDHIFYVGTEAPTLSNAYAWLNPEEDEDFAVSMEDAIQAAKDAKLYAQIAQGYVLPAATATSIGGVKVGANLSVTADGVLSLNFNTSDYYTKTQVNSAIATALESIGVGDGVKY